jgi:hypothetical protein
MFTSKDKLRLQNQRLEDMAYAAAYELMINTKLSEANAREMFLETYPDYEYVIDEVIEEVKEM